VSIIASNISAWVVYGRRLSNRMSFGCAILSMPRGRPIGLISGMASGTSGVLEAAIASVTGRVLEAGGLGSFKYDFINLPERAI